MDMMTSNDSDSNYYRLLNVSPSASPKEIREAYLRMKAVFTSDNQALYSMMSESETKHTLNMIEEAYQILHDEYRRDMYDNRLRMEREHGRDRKAAATLAPTGMDDHYAAGAESRKPLPLIRTKAVAAAKEDIQTHMARIIEEGDLADGDLLRKIREACQVTIDELQERTKILADYIRGIEENRFERLPPSVYVKGFLRSYLKYLAVPNNERIVTAYAERLENWRNSTGTNQSTRL
jgi:hypothetical protein